MSVSDENLVGLKLHGIFDTGVIFQSHQNVLTKGSSYLFITIVLRFRTIWHEVFVKLRVSFDVLICRKEVSQSLVTTLRHKLMWLYKLVS